MVMIIYNGRKGVYRIGKAIYANFTYIEEVDIRGCKKKHFIC